MIVTQPRPLGAWLAAGAAFAVVATSFFGATTFAGDDHLFLAFARYAPNPLIAFVRDQHGGEFYRPLPMLVWWLFGRAAGAPPSTVPFAALALGLHAAVAALLGALLSALGRARSVAVLAAALFFIGPQNIDAASWFSASTDLLATTFTLAALLALVRGRGALSALLALGAYLSKESALVRPGLALVVLGARAEPGPRLARVRAVAPHALLAALVLAARFAVLGGWGGGGDARAPLLAKLLQLANGVVHVATGSVVLPLTASWVLGTVALGLLICFAVRARRTPAVVASFAPLIFTAVALLPLLGPGWIVGARYFYLPAAGLAWAAGEALGARSLAARVTVALALLVVGALQSEDRHADVVSYEARLAAVRSAVADGARGGARVFHVDGGIKDLDLAVKEDPAVESLADELLVLGDVPASFVLVPPALEARAAIFVARPALPPSGAYRFGARRIVGLARRGADPTLAETVEHFPGIRFLRLRAAPGGRVVARDVTEELRLRE
jgi:hypothetical protein